MGETAVDHTYFSQNFFWYRERLLAEDARCLWWFVTFTSLVWKQWKKVSTKKCSNGTSCVEASNRSLKNSYLQRVHACQYNHQHVPVHLQIVTGRIGSPALEWQNLNTFVLYSDHNKLISSGLMQIAFCLWKSAHSTAGGWVCPGIGGFSALPRKWWCVPAVGCAVAPFQSSVFELYPWQPQYPFLPVGLHVLQPGVSVLYSANLRAQEKRAVVCQNS